MPDPLCHRPLPLPREAFSEIHRSADMPDSLPSASTGLTRSTRWAPGERTGISGTAVRESGRGICGLRRRASHGIAMALSRLSTAARHGYQGSSHASRPACRHLHSSAPCVMQSAAKLSRPGRIVNRCSENRHDTQVGPTVHVVTYYDHDARPLAPIDAGRPCQWPARGGGGG